MAGMIQTAVGRLLGTTAAAVGVGKKVYDKAQGQTLQETPEEPKAPEATVQKNEKGAPKVNEAELYKEANAVATEADLRNFGASEIAAKAYRLAQERGTASPERIIFDENGKALATYKEMAEILADQSLTDTFTSRLRSKNRIEERRKLLEGKTHKERVENAILSVGGGQENGKK